MQARNCRICQREIRKYIRELNSILIIQTSDYNTVHILTWNINQKLNWNLIHTPTLVSVMLER